MVKFFMILVVLLGLVSCGKDSSNGGSVTSVDIVGSTYYLQNDDTFNYLSISGSREVGESITVTIKDFEIAEGVKIDCVLSGQVSLSNTYSTNFTASIDSSGDTAVDVECSNRFSGFTNIQAGDNFLRYHSSKDDFNLTL